MQDFLALDKNRLSYAKEDHIAWDIAPTHSCRLTTFYILTTSRSCQCYLTTANTLLGCRLGLPLHSGLCNESLRCKRKVHRLLSLLPPTAHSVVPNTFSFNNLLEDLRESTEHYFTHGLLQGNNAYLNKTREEVHWAESRKCLDLALPMSSLRKVRDSIIFLELILQCASRY
jgi:hypothetical protein